MNAGLPRLCRFAPPRERGIAFVLVLWVIAMLAILLGSFSLVARTENLQARHLFDTTQARYAAEAGLNLAVYELRKSDPAARWIGDGRPYNFNFGDTEIEVQITDESGKIDLNATCGNTVANIGAPVAGGPSMGLGILLNLFVNTGGLPLDQAQALVAAVSDWCDDNDETQLNGAEFGEYEAAGLSYGPTNQPFQTVSELQQVLGMNYELFSKIEPSLTILSGRAEPSLAYADAATMHSFCPEQSLEELQQIVQLRQSLPPEELAAAGLTVCGMPVMAGGGGLTYSVKSRAKLPNGASTTLDATIRMGGVGAGGRPYSILRWRDGETS